MRTITEHIRDHLYEICGLYEQQSMDDCVLEQCKWSVRFMELMINRITVGRYRYGRKDSAIRGKYDYIGSIIKRMDSYKMDGNLEHLVDIANLCMLEFEIGTHPRRHFKPIDDGEHVHENTNT